MLRPGGHPLPLTPTAANPKPMKSRLLPLCLLPALACASTESAHSPVSTPRALAFLRTAPGESEALEEIARIEDARTDPRNWLPELATGAESERVRERATAALGRMPMEGVDAGRTPRTRNDETMTDALVSALDDRSASVRAAAAFGIGLRGDARAEAGLLAHWQDADSTVRARIVEAASKLNVARLREEVLYALGDPDEVVRIEAVIAPHRWDPELPDAAEADSALIRILDREMERTTGSPREGTESELAWRALFTLQRRASARARDAFIQYSRVPASDLERLFAVKGLARIDAAAAAPDPSNRPYFESALQDVDWRVVCEAVRGLAADDEEPASAALLEVATHRSAHARRELCEALSVADGRTLAVLADLREDSSNSVRGAALVAEARLTGADMRAELEGLAQDADPMVRAAVAEAERYLPAEIAVPTLRRLAGDPHHRVAGIAIESLGVLATERARSLLLEILVAGGDNGRRLAAVTALLPSAGPDDLAALRRAFHDSEGDVGPELRFNCLRDAGAIGTPEAMAFVHDGLRDPHPHVRRVAQEVLAEHDALPGQIPPPPPTPARPLPDIEYVERNPMVEISTSRGMMVFELFPNEAPLHVYNLLELTRDDHYDGLDFHRVVPDFVIQGGCYRADGNGATTWRGGGLPLEVGPRKFARGALGMPRNEDLDSGGSQIFVTHRPTPHLDGRYTVFGQLRSGFEVLDAIEVGDKILDVRRR